MSDGRNGFKTFFSFFSGAVIGAGLALLFAPQAGKETRRKIKGLSDKIQDDIKDNMEKISDSAKNLYSETKEKLKKKSLD